jgi:hypothetical protein
MPLIEVPGAASPLNDGRPAPELEQDLPVQIVLLAVGAGLTGEIAAASGNCDSSRWFSHVMNVDADAAPAMDRDPAPGINLFAGLSQLHHCRDRLRTCLESADEATPSSNGSASARMLQSS